VNYFRLAEAAWINFRQRRFEQGGSTLTMQIARGFFLSPEKTTKRKLIEILISTILEQRFSKKQIFELYANQVYMGQRGSFTITGFGEAAQAYFGKDIKNLSIPEAALLAGIIQRPNYCSPYKYPERALERRNLVLETMVETNSITREGAERAKATPLKLTTPNVEAREAPYFVDLVKDTLLTRYSEHEINENSYRIYSTIDPALQQAAADAVEIGLKEVDAQVKKMRTKTIVVGKGKSAKKETVVRPGPDAQVALVAMDPRSGEVLALVGGRNYGLSQLNHAMAKRPTGSVFKPFVYAAAVNTAVSGAETVLTPTSMVDDSPTTFTYGDQIYEPRNYREEYHGPVTLRYSLALSLNNATVKIAEQTGYDKVAELARAAGIRSVQPTPAMALGAYDATPLDIASAYSAFVNAGVKVTPVLVKSLRDAKGNVIENFTTSKQQVMDSRVAYIMTNMMEGVLNFGTAAGVRSRGFYAPAAGKTGTSHDAWFAGYTTNLLCIVWVGYDDYSDLRLSGATTAAPIWGEFMKRAVAMPAYKDAQPFAPPEGVVSVTLDKVTNRLATASCPDDYSAAFIAGTEPKDSCESGNILTKIFGALMPKPAPPVSNPQAQPGQVPSQPGQAQPGQAAAVPTNTQPQKEEKKKGFWGRLFGGDDDEKQKEEEKQKEDNTKPQSPQPAGTEQNPR
jgi:penicillin-binding protein 1B